MKQKATKSKKKMKLKYNENEQIIQESIEFKNR